MISDISIVYIKILECNTFKMFAKCSLLSSSVEQQQQFEPRNFQKVSIGIQSNPCPFSYSSKITNLN